MNQERRVDAFILVSLLIIGLAMACTWGVVAYGDPLCGFAKCVRVAK